MGTSVLLNELQIFLVIYSNNFIQIKIIKIVFLRFLSHFYFLDPLGLFRLPYFNALKKQQIRIYAEKINFNIL